MIDLSKEELTSEDVFRIFGRLRQDVVKNKQARARYIVEKYGIEYETFIEKVFMVKNGEKLYGSIYLNQEITEFCKL